MKSCTNCGNELGVGRFCMNCGHPIEWRTDTAERPAVPPVPPPPAEPPPGPPPPPPRFPLYADELPPTGPPVSPPAGPSPHRRNAGPWVTWLAVAVVLTLVAGLGLWLLTRTDDAEPTSASDNNPPASSPKSERPSDQSSSSAPASQPGELASRADVAVPATAEPNQDVSGNQVRYDGANMLDGVPETCWRMPGDGTGDEIVVTLPAETRLASVGIVNGYAKSAQDAQGRELDWYHGNRRVLTVEWVFDDGTTLIQQLDDTMELQSEEVDVTTTTITVRLLDVSKPGKGPESRDFTAISDLSFVGR